MEYTKGEWRYTIIGLESKVVDDKVNVIAHIEGRNKLEEIEANARLIATAPDLYKALKDAEQHLIMTGCKPDSYARRNIKKALAKAEGK